MTYFNEEIFQHILSYCGETHEQRRDRLWKKIGMRREAIDEGDAIYFQEDGSASELVLIHPTIDGKIVSCRPTGTEIFEEEGMYLEEMYEGGETTEQIIDNGLSTGVIYEGCSDWWNSCIYDQGLKTLDDDYYDHCWAMYFEDVEDRHIDFANVNDGNSSVHWY